MMMNSTYYIEVVFCFCFLFVLAVVLANKDAYTGCLKKTGPLQLISHNFTNPQHSLIIFGTERP